MPKRDYSEDFERAWAEYPKRFPDNPKWPAFLGWNARIREGIHGDLLIQCVKNYRDHCRRAGKEGTEYVLMAQTFFGPNERFRAFAPRPASRALPKQEIVSEEPLASPAEALAFTRDIISKLSAKVSIR